ncbi:MAG: tRNA preQ1(34) S-adenosylmethionine ribosyltransferase-isomerase QueA [Alphaproteobacteria bacterium]|nr:tRNA preQ1(34) S-adenosylmethionine ribosyltransferase-isomerase QueA [Alphaproteobacteria bacterium]
MRVDQFDFDLPEGAIALRPAQPRDSARLLVVSPDGTLAHYHIRDLPGLLRPGDVIAVNDTKVIPARLKGIRLSRGDGAPEAGIEVTLHKRVAPAAFLAFARGARKLRVGDTLSLGTSLLARVASRGEGGEVELHFALEGGALDAAIAREGEMPLPPYIAGKRKPDAQDMADYQTVYARHSGSVAAPTAGLHLTDTMLAHLSVRGVGREHVTLHVGAGTFLPVSVEDTSAHKMHSEWASIDAGTAGRLNAARAQGGRIVAVGTTSLRTLESAAADDGQIHPFQTETSIFITPGYRFRAVDVLLTNFHLPRSTLFMLVCAFSGTDVMKSAYAEAIREGYRFYSYGDACLLFRPRT